MMLSEVRNTPNRIVDGWGFSGVPHLSLLEHRAPANRGYIAVADETNVVVLFVHA